MTTRRLGAVHLLILAAGLAGCGGGPPGGGASHGGKTVTVGTLQVGVESAASFRVLTLNSPGASRIAFTALYGSRIVSLREMGYGRLVVRGHDGHDSELYLMNSDGSDLMQITHNEVMDWHPTWSPDGKKLAFRSYDGNDYEIYSMNVDGSGVTQLTHDDLNCHDPGWSPDGRKIAFGGYDAVEGDHEVFMMNTDGSGLTQLTDNSANDGSPAWSPDSRRMVYNRDDGLWVMNADGSGQAPLVTGFVNPWHPAWSPDGRRIAFYAYDGADYEMYLMNADGSGLTQLTDNAVDDRHPSWRADGKRIAFERWDGADFEIYLMDPDGSNVVQVTSNSVDDIQAEFCPVPSMVRTLIGPSGSDGGGRPPFGTAKPVAIVGLTADGLVSATTIGVAERNWSTLEVAALTNIGADLAGVKIVGNNIRQVIEDRGRGLPTRVWSVSGTPTTGAVLIFFSGETGRVASVIAASDVSTADAAQVAGRVLLRGTFTEVHGARDPRRNLATATAHEIALDARTAEVTAVH